MHTGGTTNALIIQVHGRSADLFIRNGVDKEFAVSEINKFSAAPGVRDVKTRGLLWKYRSSNLTDNIFGSDVTPLWPYGGR
jgi:hypothetical protein